MFGASPFAAREVTIVCQSGQMFAEMAYLSRRGDDVCGFGEGLLGESRLSFSLAISAHAIDSHRGECLGNGHGQPHAGCPEGEGKQVEAGNE